MPGMVSTTGLKSRSTAPAMNGIVRELSLLAQQIGVAQNPQGGWNTMEIELGPITRVTLNGKLVNGFDP